MHQLEEDLLKRYGDQLDFFDHDPLLLDLSAIETETGPLDTATLFDVLKRVRLHPLAYKGGNADQRMAAQTAGLVLADDARLNTKILAQAPSKPATPTASMVVPAPTQFLDKPLRSGQQFYARGGDLVVTAMVNPGAEVVADGNIHVYAPLRGKAIAGARGNTHARIFAQELEAELISIAGVYRTSEVTLPDNVRGRAAHIRLQVSDQGERLLIEPL